MTVACQGCGAEVADEDINDYDVQPNDEKDEWRRCLVCLLCFHKLGGDMWTGEWVWETIGSKLKFSELPLLSTRENK